jgi:hypothetical protein
MPWWESETDAQFNARMANFSMPPLDMSPADRLRARMLEDRHFSERLLTDSGFRERVLSDEHFRSQVLAAAATEPASSSRPRSGFTWM